MIPILDVGLKLQVAEGTQRRISLTKRSRIKTSLASLGLRSRSTLIIVALTMARTRWLALRRTDVGNSLTWDMVGDLGGLRLQVINFPFKETLLSYHDCEFLHDIVMKVAHRFILRLGNVT